MSLNMNMTHSHPSTRGYDCSRICENPIVNVPAKSGTILKRAPFEQLRDVSSGAYGRITWVCNPILQRIDQCKCFHNVSWQSDCILSWWSRRASRTLKYSILVDSGMLPLVHMDDLTHTQSHPTIHWSKSDCNFICFIIKDPKCYKRTTRVAWTLGGGFVTI